MLPTTSYGNQKQPLIGEKWEQSNELTAAAKKLHLSDAKFHEEQSICRQNLGEGRLCQ